MYISVDELHCVQLLSFNSFCPHPPVAVASAHIYVLFLFLFCPRCVSTNDPSVMAENDLDSDRSNISLFVPFQLPSSLLQQAVTQCSVMYRVA